MIDWAARLKTVFSHERQNSTAITDETPLSSVSSVPDGRAYGKHDGVSSVSSVPDGHLYEKLIEAINRCCDVRGDDDRNRDALIAEAASLSREHQLDMTAHFLSEAAIWRAVSASRHVPAPTPVSRAPVRPVPSVKTCPQCANRLRFGTCGRPIEAGLIGADEGYGIAWAPRGFAATCPAFTAKAPPS